MTPRTFFASFAPAFACGALVLATGPRALAAPSFPGNIEKVWGLNYTPPCSVCHEYGKTGNGTPITPFAWSLRAHGLSGSRGSTTSSLAADRDAGLDSDGDGVTDYDEFLAGTDPNSPGNDCIIPVGANLTAEQCTPGTQASPSLGCAVGRPGTKTGDDGAVALLGLALVAARRRRREPVAR